MSSEFTVEFMGVEAEVFVHTEDAGNTVEVYLEVGGKQWPLELKTQGRGYSVRLFMSDGLKIR